MDEWRGHTRRRNNPRHVPGVDLGASHLHEAHVRTLGSLGFVGVHHVFTLAAALLLAILAGLLVLLGLLAGLGGGVCVLKRERERERWDEGVSTCGRVEQQSGAGRESE